MQHSELQLEKITKDMGEFVLEADFRASPGERLALIGRSGSGKTTLLRLIAGLESLDSGRILLGELDLTNLPPQKRQVGFVFQDQALFPALNVLENATFGLRARGVEREEREARALEWLERVGLKNVAHAGVGRLSGGEAQRVALVRALICEPRVLLLDEPFSALDTGLRASLRREVVELHKLWPVPLLLVSHDEEDRVAMATGRLELQESQDHRVRRLVRTG